MFATPPKITSIVLRTINLSMMEDFYSSIGIGFNKGIQENGLEKLCYVNNNFKFELVEVKTETEGSKNVEFDILIDEIDGYIEDIEVLGLDVLRKPWNDGSGRHIVFKDPDLHTVTLRSIFSAKQAK